MRLCVYLGKLHKLCLPHFVEGGQSLIVTLGSKATGQNRSVGKRMGSEKQSNRDFYNAIHKVAALHGSNTVGVRIIAISVVARLTFTFNCRY